MSFDCSKYRDEFLKRETTNPAVILGNAAKANVQLKQVTIPQTGPPGQQYWRVRGVHHLTQKENGGDHNVYVDLLDENGKPLYYDGIGIKWGWEGQTDQQRQAPEKFDKHTPNEPMSDVPITSKGQFIWTEIEGDGASSDRVSRMGTEGNAAESYYVLYQKAFAQPLRQD
ncbi:MAG: hypothetical protein AAF639_05440 [Chloroflexota bacterium]